MTARLHPLLVAPALIGTLALAAPAVSTARGTNAAIAPGTVTVAPAARSARALTFRVPSTDAARVSSGRLTLGRRTVTLRAAQLRGALSGDPLVVRVTTTAAERSKAKLQLKLAGAKRKPAAPAPTPVSTPTPPAPTPTAPTPTPPAPTPPASIPGGPVSFGIHGKLRWRSGPDLDATVATIAEAHLTVDREDLSWSRIEATRGSYDWSSFDRAVGAAAKRGVRILAIPDDPPAWATGQWNVAPVSGAPLDAYTAFLRAAIRRYGSTGSFWADNPAIPRTPIVEWDIWNEPYLSYSWANSSLPDPIAYGTMFRDAVAAVESEDPAARFLLEADTAITESAYPYKSWLGAALAGVAGLADHVDGISLHDYTHDAGVCTPYAPSRGVDADYVATAFQFCKVLDARRILDAHGLQQAGVWITETGASTAPGSPAGVSEDHQAQIIHDVFTQLRGWHVVSGLIFYELGDTPGAAPDDKEGFFGLHRADGSAKPAWSALLSEVAAGLPSPS